MSISSLQYQSIQLSETKNLELLAKQVVEGFIIGLHRSPFHGFSVEFAEHRLYNVGESTKNIDWKVYGRSDKLFIKKYEEETNLRCHIVIDTSSSMYFPDEKECKQNKILNKIQFSVLAAASLIQLLKKQRDAFGLTLFDQEISLHTECKSTTLHQKLLFSYLEKLIGYESNNKKTSTIETLHEIAEKIHRRSLVIIFSDMLDKRINEENDELFLALRHLKHNKHEVILFHTTDADKEFDFNFENRPYQFIDLETGAKLKLNPSEVKEVYLNKIKAFKKSINDKCAQYKIDVIDADIRKGIDQILMPYLIKRSKMK
jgi:uncharacterized protein (DUF58 family)